MKVKVSYVQFVEVEIDDKYENFEDINATDEERAEFTAVIEKATGVKEPIELYPTKPYLYEVAHTKTGETIMMF